MLDITIVIFTLTVVTVISIQRSIPVVHSELQETMTDGKMHLNKFHKQLSYTVN